MMVPYYDVANIWYIRWCLAADGLPGSCLLALSIWHRILIPTTG